MDRRKRTNLLRMALVAGLLSVAAFLSIATSSGRRPLYYSGGSTTATVRLANPFPTGVFAKLVGPVVRLYYLPAHTTRTVVVPAGSFRLYWRRPSYMRFYRYYRLYYFSPGSVTRWKIGMI